MILEDGVEGRGSVLLLKAPNQDTDPYTAPLEGAGYSVTQVPVIQCIHVSCSLGTLLTCCPD